MLSPHVYESLRCHTCHNYLSVFPVNSYGERMVCGRCPVLEDFNPHVEVLYEKLACAVKFPCQYDIRGCVEKLHPADLSGHESVCSYRTFQCPYLGEEDSEECSYEIELEGLLEHFMDNHREFLFDCVELDTVTKYERNYLECVNNDLFVVQMKSEPQKKAIYVQLKYCGNAKSGERYSFCITFRNRYDDIMTTEPAYGNVYCGDLKRIDLSLATKFNTDELRVNLTNPSSIICCIQIILKSLNIAKGVLTSSNDEYLKKMECPVCLMYMVPPIMLCSTGHSFCKTCHHTLKECPLCRSGMSNIQNYVLNEISELIKYPCKNREYHCAFRGHGKDLELHEQSCAVGPIACILENCGWKGTLCKLIDHVKADHFDRYLHKNVVNVMLDGCCQEDEMKTFVVAKFGCVFKLYFSVDGNLFKWTLQLVGPETDHFKYMLELDITDTKGMSSERIFCKKLCTQNTRPSLAFARSDHCIIMHRNALKHAMEEDTFIFTYRISEV